MLFKRIEQNLHPPHTKNEKVTLLYFLLNIFVFKNNQNSESIIQTMESDRSLTLHDACI